MGFVLDKIKFNRELVLLLAVMGLCLSLRMAFLHEPFERDEGQYAYIGQEILRGGMPYKDVIEIKPPGAFYLYALAIGLCGDTTEAIRVFTACYSLLTVLVVYGIARRVAGGNAGLWAALLYALYASGPGLQGSSSNTEVFMVLPLAASAYFFLVAVDSGRRLPLVASGTMASVAMLIKTVALPQVALIFACLFFLKFPPRNLKALALNLVSFLMPVLVMALLTIGWFAYRGALDEFLYWNVTFPIHYIDAGVSGPNLSKVLKFLTPELILPVVTAVPTFIWLLARRRDLKGVLTALLLPAACIGVWLPHKYFPHYFIQLMPSLAIMGGIGIAQCFKPRWPRILTGIVLLALFSYRAVKEYRFYFIYTPEMVSILKYGNQFAESVKLAAYIKERTRPDDYIFQWGLEPELYFLSGRRSPNRNVASIAVGWAKDPQRELSELVGDINRKKPRIITMQPEWATFFGVYSIEDILKRDYVEVAYIANCYVYQRR